MATVMPKLPISFDDPIADDQALADYQAKLPVEMPQQLVGIDAANAVNNLFAPVNSVPRYQTWPEVMLRSGASLPLETYQGKVPTSLGLRREDFTDIPQDRQSSNTWLGGKLGINEGQELGPSGELISRAQDMAGMAGGGSVAGVEKGAVGTLGGDLTRNEPKADMLAMQRQHHQNIIRSDTAEPGAAVAALERAPVFYSAVEKAVKEAKQPSASADQWLGYLRNQPGVKQEELDWVLHDLPAGKITKSELEQYVQEHKVELKEVNKGQYDPDYVNTEQYHNDLEKYSRDKYRLPYDELVDSQQQIIRKQALNNQNIYPTKYSQWQLPGAENYREQLLTLPERKIKMTHGQMEARYLELENKSNRTPLEEKEYSDLWSDVMGEKGEGTDANINYRSSHWDEPNVLAHIRTNDRSIPGVGNSLHIEEIQSDWHQAGRKQGYKGEVEKLKSTFDAAEKKILDSNDEAIMGNPDLKDSLRIAVDKKIITPDEAKAYQRHVDIGGDININTPVPDAPLKTNWPDLALKRVIRQAAEQGKDSISWTPGEAQALRYQNDVRQKLNAIDWHNKKMGKINPSGEKQILVSPSSGSEIELTVDKDGRIVGGHKELKGKSLESVLGKDIAGKVLGENEGNIDAKGYVMNSEPMKAFYDKMLVDKANAIAKKFGGKVEQATFNVREKGAAPSDYKTQPVHVLRITPQLRDAALNKGFSLFADTGKVGAPLAALTKVDHNPFTHTVTPVEHNPFTVDTYHGAPRPFKGTEIKTAPLNELDVNPKTTEFFSTPNPELASEYSKSPLFMKRQDQSNIMPLKIDARDYHTYDAKGKTWDEVNAHAIYEAHQLNKKGIIIKDVQDDAHPRDKKLGPQTVYITLDPSTVRSRFAKFDPAKFHENGLLKSDNEASATAAALEHQYRGIHISSDAESGSPMHDVTANGTYPKDFYSHNGLKYYGTGDDALDAASYRKIVDAKDNPDKMIRVFRAIPWEGKKPGYLLRSGGPSGGKINPGDWVTISKKYAQDHGESALNDKYAIVDKMVPAKEIFTSGDSMHEWGWHPNLKASGLPIITDKDGKQLDHNLKPLTVDEQNALLDRNPLPTHKGPDGKAVSMPSKTALGLAAMKAGEYIAWAARPALGPALWTSSILGGAVMNAAPKKELKEGRPLGGYRLVPVAHDPFAR